MRGEAFPSRPHGSAAASATGFKPPVHCCFDDGGNCYVTEAGFKTESRPRILRVDVATGDPTSSSSETASTATKDGSAVLVGVVRTSSARSARFSAVLVLPVWLV